MLYEVPPTHIRPNIRVIILRLLFFLRLRDAHDWLRDRLALAQVRERVVVHLVDVARLRHNLEVDLRLAVLNDSTQVGVRVVV